MSKEHDAEVRELRGRIAADVAHLADIAQARFRESLDKFNDEAQPRAKQITKLAHAYTLLNAAIETTIDSPEASEGIKQYLRNALDTARKANS